MADMFRDGAPMSAAEATLDGGARWTVATLVGAHAFALDEAVPADPDGVYAPGIWMFVLIKP